MREANAVSEPSAALPDLPAEQVLPLFAAADLSPRAFAEALTGSGVLSQQLVAGDPFKGTSPRLVLDDANWISLQSICFDG